MQQRFDIVVVGAGPAGQIAAIAMARGGRRVALVGPRPDGSDRRTTALMHQSLDMMERLGLWDELKPQAAALQTMQIIDGTKRLLRAPTVAFRSAEIDLPAFGYNIPNAALLSTLAEAVEREPLISRFDQTAETITIDDREVRIALSGDEEINADFVIGGDGRRSATRESAGVGVKTWSYPQTAVVLNFGHILPHQNISTEFHTESGPFTQVPLPGQRSSLVWVVTPKEAERLLGLDTAALSGEVETRMQSMLGKVTVEDGVQAWPLSGMTANHYGKGRAAFIGEAGHAFPPIGAQGLNLSLRDIAALEDLLVDRQSAPIAASVGDRFHARRRLDIASRTASVDLLNRSLLSSLLPVQMLRAAGLQVLATVAPLRNLVMQEGVAPGRGLRSLPTMLREKIRR
ncbi:2-octaprenyl-6-methoxyphenyl hydroxylase [Rhizobium sp. Root274]|uniref:UbiH/UbiF family hydroxylase n=1 Tax=unclassified Rhizobium TaxID=2613769 RepID=UPI000714B69E|nr:MULTISPECIES: UbiH/UbiF family hydroxylase [unclassified Rhizobium]KQW27050.1 2-octaprenyl-6-methoxyphenyl hydroxylase [Rhizobium sp. Root1240]KRD28021.1 2-octaprenyl-6-methoxyphenyl hydroxylase [Rhizobium sp. Root274]